MIDVQFVSIHSFLGAPFLPGCLDQATEEAGSCHLCRLIFLAIPVNEEKGVRALGGHVAIISNMILLRHVTHHDKPTIGCFDSKWATVRLNERGRHRITHCNTHSTGKTERRAWAHGTGIEDDDMRTRGEMAPS